jgi:hypothetical protein
MAVELPTAFMYFGAISAILAPRLDPVAQILLLTLYHALFVTPSSASARFAVSQATVATNGLHRRR